MPQDWIHIVNKERLSWDSQASCGYLECESQAHCALLGTKFMRRLRYHALRHIYASERLDAPLSQAGIACSPSRQPGLFASFSSHEIIMPCGRPCLILQIASSTGNLLQLHLLRELLIKLTELLDQILACIDNCLLWRNLAVGLHTELEGREKWVRNLVAGEEDVVCLGELCAQEVTECVILLVECEHGGIGDASLWLMFHLLLAFSKEERLEPIWRIHFADFGDASGDSEKALLGRSGSK